MWRIMFLNLPPPFPIYAHHGEQELIHRMRQILQGPGVGILLGVLRENGHAGQPGMSDDELRQILDIGFHLIFDVFGRQGLLDLASTQDSEPLPAMVRLQVATNVSRSPFNRALTMQSQRSAAAGGLSWS
jgi:hypothetical protein